VLALAGQDAYFKFQRRALTHYGTLTEWAYQYEGWARDAGVPDIDVFRKSMIDKAWAARVKAGEDLGKRLGVASVPVFFVNGARIEGSPDRLRSTIDEQVRKARAKVAAGTPRSRVYLTMTRENAADLSDDGEANHVPIGTSPVLGPNNALVTVVEFGDLDHLPTTRAEPAVARVRNANAGKLRLVWKHFPRSVSYAEQAAAFAIEVRARNGDAGFWRVHDQLLHPDFDDLDSLAGLQGISPLAPFVLKHRAVIDADQALGRKLAVREDPCFFVNGKRVASAEKLGAVVEREIKEAEKLVALGIPATQVYETIMRTARGAP
jgi:protein-disulfide isomerase